MFSLEDFFENVAFDLRLKRNSASCGPGVRAPAEVGRGVGSRVCLV